MELETPGRGGSNIPTKPANVNPRASVPRPLANASTRNPSSASLCAEFKIRVRIFSSKTMVDRFVMYVSHRVMTSSTAPLMNHSPSFWEDDGLATTPIHLRSDENGVSESRVCVYCQIHYLGSIRV